MIKRVLGIIMAPIIVLLSLFNPANEYRQPKSRHYDAIDNIFIMEEKGEIEEAYEELGKINFREYNFRAGEIYRFTDILNFLRRQDDKEKIKQILDSIPRDTKQELIFIDYWFKNLYEETSLVDITAKNSSYDGIYDVIAIVFDDMETYTMYYQDGSTGEIIDEISFIGDYERVSASMTDIVTKDRDSVIVTKENTDSGDRQTDIYAWENNRFKLLELEEPEEVETSFKDNFILNIKDEKHDVDYNIEFADSIKRKSIDRGYYDKSGKLLNSDMLIKKYSRGRRSESGLAMTLDLLFDDIGVSRFGKVETRYYYDDNEIIIDKILIISGKTNKEILVYGEMDDE